MDVVFPGVWVLHRINKDGGYDSLPLLAFRRDVANVIFLKDSKEDRLSSSYVGIRIIPSNVIIRGGCRGLPLLPMQHPEMADLNFQS